MSQTDRQMTERWSLHGSQNLFLENTCTKLCWSLTGCTESIIFYSLHHSITWPLISGYVPCPNIPLHHSEHLCQVYEFHILITQDRDIGKAHVLISFYLRAWPWSLVQEQTDVHTEQKESLNRASASRVHKKKYNQKLILGQLLKMMRL